jgi:hypothetical protein
MSGIARPSGDSAGKSHLSSVRPATQRRAANAARVIPSSSIAPRNSSCCVRSESFFLATINLSISASNNTTCISPTGIAVNGQQRFRQTPRSLLAAPWPSPPDMARRDPYGNARATTERCPMSALAPRAGSQRFGGHYGCYDRNRSQRRGRAPSHSFGGCRPRGIRPSDHRIDPPLNAQLERTAFLRENQPCVGHEATILPSIQSRAGTALVAPFDIAIERCDCALVRQVDTAGATAFRDRAAQADLFATRARFGEYIADFNACNFRDSHPACNAKQEDQGVALGKSACRVSDAQQMAKFGGGENFGAFGLHVPISECARKSSLLRERKHRALLSSIAPVLPHFLGKCRRGAGAGPFLASRHGQEPREIRVSLLRTVDGYTV